MDISTIAGSSLLLRTEQTQQALSTTMMKLAANQQDKVADLLAQNARQTAAKGSNGFNFSAYA